MSDTLVKHGKMAIKIGSTPAIILGITNVTWKRTIGVTEVADASNVNATSGLVEPVQVATKITDDFSWDGNAYASAMGAFDMAKQAGTGALVAFEFVADSTKTEKATGNMIIESIEIAATMDKTGTCKGSGKASGHVDVTAVSA